MSFSFGGGGGFGGNNSAPATPFGAQPSTPAFGATPAPQNPATSSAFGAPATGFGQQSPAFGQSSTGFGQTSTFGQTSAFGSNAPKTSAGTSSFGGFGSTNTFGNNNNNNNAAASPFGAAVKPAAASSPFGGSSVFGQQNTGASAGFGTTSTFGSTSTPSNGFGSTGFGANTQKAPFGSTQTQSTFAGGSSFGSAGGGFGASSGFGATAAPQQQQQQQQQPNQPQVGTGNPPYSQTSQTGTSGTDTFVSITRMPAYSHKSTEELRYEDYLKRSNPQAAQQAAIQFAPQPAQQPAASGGFGTGFGGASTSQTSTFGAQSSGFGGGSAFGSTPQASIGFGTTSAFGNTQQNSTGFGATSAFGGNTQTSSGFGTTSAFGSTPQPSTGGFGTSAFGNTGGTSAFGGGQASTSTFGAASQPMASGGFNSQPSTFGAANNNTSGGFGAQPSGFGATTQPAQSGFGFGTQQPQQQQANAGNNAFGGASSFNKPAATSSFGTFGSGFGATSQPQQQQAQPQTSLFGGNTQQTSGFGGFGTTQQTNNTGGFGATGGGFGATQQQQQPANTGFGGFGSTGGGFGASTSTANTTGGSLFGGNTQSTQGSGFNFGGQNNQSSSLFGSKPAQQNTGSNLFGNNTGSSLFGNTGASTGTSLFGNNTSSFGAQPQQPQQSGFNFGGTQQQSGFGTGTSLFSQNQQQQPQQPQMLMASVDKDPYGAGNVGHGLVEQKVKAALEFPTPSGGLSSKLSRFASDVGLPIGPIDTSLASRRQLVKERHSAVPVTMLHTPVFKGTARKNRYAGLFNVAKLEDKTKDGEEEVSFTTSKFNPKDALKLVIRRDGEQSPKKADVVPVDSADDTDRHGLRPDEDNKVRVHFRNKHSDNDYMLKLDADALISSVQKKVQTIVNAEDPTIGSIQLVLHGRVLPSSSLLTSLSLTDKDEIAIESREDKQSEEAPKAPKSKKFASYDDYLSSALEEELHDQASERSTPQVPKLTNPDYYTHPPMDELKTLTDEELSQVHDFTVVRKDRGRVQWLGPTDVRGLDLDDLVEIKPKEVIVYPDDDKKHELGTKLNKPATVELWNVFPPKSQDPEVYTDRVRNRTEDMQATYLEYNARLGLWRFRVEHFSRYGFADEDEDEDEDQDMKKKSLPDRQDVDMGSSVFTSSKAALVQHPHSSDRQPVASFFSQPSAPFSFFHPLGQEEEEVEGSTSAVPRGPEASDVLEMNTCETFAVPRLPRLQPRGLNAQTSRLPPAKQSATYALLRKAAHTRDSVRVHVDQSLFLGRSFRCSFGPKGLLLDLTSGMDSSTLHQQVDIKKPLMPTDVSKSSKKLLQVHRNQATVSTTSKCPFISLPTMSSDENSLMQVLRSYAEADVPHSDVSRLFRLFQALFGQEPTVTADNYRLPIDVPIEEETWASRGAIERRRNAFSCWLGQSVPQDKSTTLSCLLSHDLVTAAEHAISDGDFHLATLLSQADSYGPSSAFKELMEVQYDKWDQSGRLAFMSKDLFLVYSLLTGLVEVVADQENLSWLQTLALVFWFKQTGNISNAISEFLRLVEKGVCSPPKADGVESDSSLFLLLQLYVDAPSVAFTHLLSPTGISGQGQLDYAVSFHLLQMLLALEYQIPQDVQTHVTHAYLEKLQSLGRWQDSIHVALTLQDDVEREQTCRNLLTTFAPYLSSEDETNLVEECHIPMQWVAHSKAVLARSEHRHHDEIELWIQAGEYHLAHETLLEHVAHALFLSNELSVLYTILSALDEHQQEVANWDTASQGRLGGALWYEFLTLQQSTEEMDEATGRLDRMMKLRTALTPMLLEDQQERQGKLVKACVSRMVARLAEQAVELQEAQDDLLSPSFLQNLGLGSATHYSTVGERGRSTQLRAVAMAFIDSKA